MRSSVGLVTSSGQGPTYSKRFGWTETALMDASGDCCVSKGATFGVLKVLPGERDDLHGAAQKTGVTREKEVTPADISSLCCAAAGVT